MKPSKASSKTANKTNRHYLESMLRVNLAGEYGAKQIYRGQLDVLKGHSLEPVLQHMAAQEAEHLDYFTKAVPKHHVRPTALFPLWHTAGYLLGAATAAMGTKAAMACTVAVEEAINDHYAEQEVWLEARLQEDPDNIDYAALLAVVQKFRLEELEHRDTGLEYNAKDAPAYGLLHKVINTACKAAIAVTKRV